MKAVFLDRDGVINQDLSSYVLRPSDLHFLPGVLDALAVIARTDFRTVIVTNQSAIGRGLMTRSELDQIHVAMLGCIERAGGRIDGIYVCPHRPDQQCTCRKPATALLERATAELDLDLSGSYFIGDAVSDVQAANAVGCKPVLVLTGRGQSASEELQAASCQRHRVSRDLRQAIDLIVACEQSGEERVRQCTGT